MELAVQVAASICESLQRQHCRVELALNDQLLVAGESVGSFHRIMDALAQAMLTDAASATSRRSASPASFGITVTTPVGLRQRGQQRSGQHVICVSDGTLLQSTSAVAGAWILLCKSHEVDVELPRRWKGACDVR